MISVSKTIIGTCSLVVALCIAGPVSAQYNYRSNNSGYRSNYSGNNQGGGYRSAPSFRPGLNNSSSSSWNTGGWNNNSGRINGGSGYPGPVRQLPYRPGLSNTSGGWNDNFGNQPGYGSSRPGLVNNGWNNNSFSNYTPQYNNHYHNNVHANSSYYDNSYGTGSYSGYQPAPAYAATNSPIVIEGCDDTDLTFTLSSGSGSWERRVAAGSAYKCVDDREWYIEFHRGGSFETARYRLKPGIYHFRGSDHGWELYKKLDL